MYPIYSQNSPCWKTFLLSKDSKWLPLPWLIAWTWVLCLGPWLDAAVAADTAWHHHGGGGKTCSPFSSPPSPSLCRPVTLSLPWPGLQKNTRKLGHAQIPSEKWPIFLTLRTEWIFGKTLFEGECDISGHKYYSSLWGCHGLWTASPAIQTMPCGPSKQV